MSVTCFKVIKGSDLSFAGNFQEKVSQLYQRVEQCDSDLLELKQSLETAQEEVVFYKRTIEEQTAGRQRLEEQMREMEENSKAEMDRCRVAVCVLLQFFCHHI